MTVSNFATTCQRPVIRVLAECLYEHFILMVPQEASYTDNNYICKYMSTYSTNHNPNLTVY